MVLLWCAVFPMQTCKAGELDIYNSPETTIAVEVGTVTEAAARKAFPNATYIYVNDVTEGYVAVQTGKADAYAGDKEAYICAMTTGLSGLSCTENIGESSPISVGVSPVPEM